MAAAILLSAYLGSRYISSDKQIQDLFARMAAIAQLTGATFLIVHHPNKARSGAAVMRSAGSLAVTAAARSVMLIARDPEDPSGRILAVVKGNLGPPPPARRFHFVQEQGSSQPHIHWDGVAETVTADTLLHKDSREDRAQVSAERFLRETLADGPIPSKELEEHALAQGYSRSVLARAKMAITHSTRTGGIGAAGAWQTSLKTSADSRSEIVDLPRKRRTVPETLSPPSLREGSLPRPTQEGYSGRASVSGKGDGGHRR